MHQRCDDIPARCGRFAAAAAAAAAAVQRVSVAASSGPAAETLLAVLQVQLRQLLGWLQVAD